MVNIALSASQQKHNQCAMGDSEADHCQLIASKAGELLRSMSNELNVFVIGPQEGDDIPALRKVVNLSNIFFDQNAGKTYHLDIHTDAGAYARGCSGIYTSEGGLCFIRPIFQEVEKLTPWVDVGLRQRNDLMVLTQTKAIAGLIEISFHDNKKEAEWIHSSMDSIANAIAQGIIRGLEIPVKEMPFDQCLAVLQQNRVINSPEYWRWNSIPGGTVSGPYANALIRNMARYILKK